MIPVRPDAPLTDLDHRDQEGSSMQDVTTELEPEPESHHPRQMLTVADFDLTAVDLAAEPHWTARPGRRSWPEKFAAGLRGLKAAIRGDSSFFAHAYRGTLIALTAALLGVNIGGWCLLVLAACLVLLSELTHSAIDTLARIVGDPEEHRIKTVREIAAAGVLVAAFASGGVTITVLTRKLGELLGWWI
jgi:diacylglycerol kinase